jgi:PAP2 superfamily
VLALDTSKSATRVLRLRWAQSSKGLRSAKWEMRLGAVAMASMLLASAPVLSEDVSLPALHSDAPASVGIDNGVAGARRSFGSQLIYDTRYVLTAPARWDRNDWKWFGLTAGAVLGTAALLDKRESDVAADRQLTLDKVATKLEPFGAGYSLATLAGFYGAGKLLDSPRAVAVGEDGLAASIIAGGIISPLLKLAVGRVRPRNTANKAEFHPFSRNHSFPSGHATQAFTVATVISAHYPSPWVSAGAYTVASFVGYARHEHNAHWASDVVAGAALGVAVGRTVVKLNDENRGVHLSVVPGENGPMVAFVIPFD